MSKILKSLIRQSYNLPNGDKLRQASLEYGYIHNSFKKSSLDTANEMFWVSEIGKDYSNKFASEFVMSESLKINVSEVQHIIDVNISPSEMAKLTQEGNEKIVKKLIDNLPPELQKTLIQHFQKNAHQTPFIATLTAYAPWMVGFIVAAIITYLIYKNPKKAKKILDFGLKQVKNLGVILGKVLATSYKWLVIGINKTIEVGTPILIEGGKMLLKGLGQAGEILLKGLQFGGKLLLEAIKYTGTTILPKVLSTLLGISIEAIEISRWLIDRERYGERTANYLQRLRSEDKEKEKLLMYVKQNLNKSRTARLHLIKTAFECDYNLGNYLQKRI
jgi:hypothetical protein